MRSNTDETARTDANLYGGIWGEEGYFNDRNMGIILHLGEMFPREKYLGASTEKIVHVNISFISCGA